MNKESTFKRSCIGFTKVSHTITRNSGLSVPAIGLVTKLLSNKDGFAIHKETEQKRSGLGEKRFNQVWGELEAKGFIKSVQIRNQFLIWHYTIINDPNIDDEVVPEVQAPLDYPQESTPEKQGVKNQPLLSRAGKVGDNIDVSKIELKNLDISNKEEKNINEIIIGKIEIPVDLPINDESVDGIITSGSTVNTNGNLILDNNAVEVINDNLTLEKNLTIENFHYNTSVNKIYEDDFSDEIWVRKHLFLTYWYNQINPTRLTEDQLLLYNDKKIFQILSWLLRDCINFKQLGLQPNRFFDTPIIKLLEHISIVNESFDNPEQVRPKEVADTIFIQLKNDRYKLSKYLEEIYT